MWMDRTLASQHSTTFDRLMNNGLLPRVEAWSGSRDRCRTSDLCAVLGVWEHRFVLPATITKDAFQMPLSGVWGFWHSSEKEKNPGHLNHQGIEPFCSRACYRRIDQEMYCDSDDCDEVFGLLACIEGRYIDCGGAIAYTLLSENMRCDTCWEDFFKIKTEREDCSPVTEAMYPSPHTTRPW
jgi:hypothetical protein